MTPPAFDRTLFGRDMAQRIWLRLMRMRPINGMKMNGIYLVHRDYCGHGLIRVEDGIELTEIYDGMPRGSLRTWTDAESFIDFWSQQSDFSCSGHDASAPAIFLRGKWEYPDNPRIDRKRLEGTLRGDTRFFWDQDLVGSDQP